MFDTRSEEIFGALQVLMAMLLSFAHGANDIANSVGALRIF
jgi:phosphate/sulfate permease